MLATGPDRLVRRRRGIPRPIALRLARRVASPPTRPFGLRFALPSTIAAVLVVGGCGADNPRTAVSVDGDTFSTSDVQHVIKDWNSSRIAASNGPITGAIIVQEFVLGHFALQQAKNSSKGISLDSARNVLTQQVKMKNPSAATVRFVQALLAVNTVYKNGSPSQAQVSSALKGASITVNPRYGTFDKTTGKVSNAAPAWIKSASPSASASATP